MSDQQARPLAELLASGPIEYRLFLTYAAQLSRELEQQHTQGIAHGEINPLTIQQLGPNEVRLMRLDSVVEATPEAVRRDLYQLGLVFMQMLVAVGDGDSGRPIHPIVLEHAPLDAATGLIPVEAKLLLEELLAEDPRDRIASARELTSTINELIEMARAQIEPSAPEKKDRSRLYFVFAMTVLISLLVWVLLEVIHKL